MTGEIITVKVTYVPKINFYNDVYYFFKFEYNDNGVLKEYSKKYFPRFCGDLVVGQELKLKADLKKNIFLCENEDVREQFYAASALGLVGLIFLILWFKNKS